MIVNQKLPYLSSLDLKFPTAMKSNKTNSLHKYRKIRPVSYMFRSKRGKRRRLISVALDPNFMPT